MSATGRGAARARDDFYETPAWCVHRYLEARGDRGCGLRWLEPSAGQGAIIRAVHRWRWLRNLAPATFTAVEAFPHEPNRLITSGVGPVHYVNFLTSEISWFGIKLDLCIGNPPYSLAQEFIEHGLKMAHEVAFLLRLNFLEGAKRAEFFKQHPCDVFVLPNRPSFQGNGKTDATAYAWFEFGGPNRGRLQILNTTPKAERKWSKL